MISVNAVSLIANAKHVSSPFEVSESIRRTENACMLSLHNVGKPAREVRPIDAVYQLALHYLYTTPSIVAGD